MTIPENLEGLREIDRTIVATYIFSSDGLLLMGRKNPAKSGTYPDAWHLPGGGVKEGETLAEAAAREANEEVLGLKLTKDDLIELPFTAEGAAPRKLSSGERVWCKMQFHHFQAVLGETALVAAAHLRAGDDLSRLTWFTPLGLESIPLIPGGRELIAQAGFFTK